MGRWRPPHRGRHHILGGGIAHISPLCYTESEIPAALRATRHTAVFRTRLRREKEGKYIRAAKRHIEPDTARHPAARFQNHIPARGRKQVCNRFINIRSGFQNHIPARGRKLLATMCKALSLAQFQNHIPARGRKPSSTRCNEEPIYLIISKPYPRKGTETRATIFNPSASASISKPYPRKGTETERQLDAPSMSALFQNHIPARGRSVSPASPARAGEGDRVSGGGGAMNASCKPS